MPQAVVSVLARSAVAAEGEDFSFPIISRSLAGILACLRNFLKWDNLSTFCSFHFLTATSSFLVSPIDKVTSGLLTHLQIFRKEKIPKALRL